MKEHDMHRRRSPVAGALITLSVALGLGVLAIDEEPPWYIYPLLLGMLGLAVMWWVRVPEGPRQAHSWMPALVGVLLLVATTFAAAWWH